MKIFSIYYVYYGNEDYYWLQKPTHPKQKYKSYHLITHKVNYLRTYLELY